MKILSKMNVFILLTLTIGYAVNTWAMDLGSDSSNCMDFLSAQYPEIMGSASDEFKTNEQNPLLTNLVVPDHKELYPILYEVLETLPPELLRIILEYYSYEFKGQLVRTFKTQSGTSIDFAVKIGKNQIALGTENSKLIEIFNIKTGNFIRNINTAGMLQNLLKLSAFKLLIACDGDGIRAMFFTVLNSKTDTILTEFYVETEGFSPPNVIKLPKELIAVSLPDCCVIKILNTQTGECASEMEDKDNVKRCLTKLPHQPVIAYCSGTDEIKFWNYETGKCCGKTFKACPAKSLITLSPTVLLAGDALRRNTLIDLNSCKSIGTFNGNVLCKLAKGLIVLSQIQNKGIITLYNPSKKTAEEFDTHHRNDEKGAQLYNGYYVTLGDVTCVLELHSGNRITCARDGTAKIWR